ncbi:hypothetical protein BDQ94DRAFT_176273 [Aspergillus welwitschiae]|uniref:Uncharacterized protein n=1 Tax=Aspergillus welwitschiae TaxID=1341132 RepID=A0A3F3PIN5_9EURO|nr:hypothetical protein BDQ94DRAFT_176273 [Aspergillus welwitschiae]RDH26602.1 hypothetical protein BDQ94DRAFT_176273 [Aspergillus welwitschiae]
MHIVNDTKWCKKDTFRLCDIVISTADDSTILEVKGGCVVQPVFRSPDGFPVTVSLLEVAYAPRRECNLFPGRMFVNKAKVTGLYSNQYMTWINNKGHTIGHASFRGGPYLLNASGISDGLELTNAIAATVRFDDPVWKWHRRLGRLGFQNVLNLLNSSTNITAKQIKAKLRAVCPASQD